MKDMESVRRTIRSLLLVLAGSGSTGLPAADDDVVAASRDPSGATNPDFELRVVGINRRQVLFLGPGERMPVRIAEPEAQRLVDQNLRNKSFEGAIFGMEVSAQRGRWKMNADLDLALQSVDRVCQLTAWQKEKLAFAGRADRKRFFDRVEALRPAVAWGAAIGQKENQEIQQLRAMEACGLLGPESFFAKSVRSMLTLEQAEKYDHDRRVTIAHLISPLEIKNIKLRPEQRDAILRPIYEDESCLIAYGSARMAIHRAHRLWLIHRLSLLTDEKIKELFDVEQWERLQPRLHRRPVIRQLLVEQGLLAPESASTDLVQAECVFKELHQ
jgi:hypothetical protein